MALDLVFGSLRTTIPTSFLLRMQSPSLTSHSTHFLYFEDTEEERLDVVDVFMLASVCGVKRTFQHLLEVYIHSMMGSLILVFTFHTQKRLSDVAQRTTSLTAVCKTPISASIALANRVQEAPVEQIRSGFDATSFSRGNVVVVEFPDILLS